MSYYYCTGYILYPYFFLTIFSTHFLEFITLKDQKCLIFQFFYSSCKYTYLLTYSMEQSPSWEANWFCSSSRNSPHFMEPEVSSPYPQVPTTCPYPELTPSSPHNPLSLPEDPSYYYPPIYVWVSPMVSFPQVSPSEPCITPLPYPIRATSPAHLILLDFTTRTILGK